MTVPTDERATCILCGSDAKTKISDRLRGDLGDRFSMRPHRCMNCGLVFMYPLMTEAEETNFYESQ